MFTAGLKLTMRNSCCRCSWIRWVLRGLCADPNLFARTLGQSLGLTAVESYASLGHECTEDCQSLLGELTLIAAHVRDLVPPDWLHFKPYVVLKCSTDEQISARDISNIVAMSQYFRHGHYKACQTYLLVIKSYAELNALVRSELMSILNDSTQEGGILRPSSKHTSVEWAGWIYKERDTFGPMRYIHYKMVCCSIEKHVLLNSSI